MHACPNVDGFLFQVRSPEDDIHKVYLYCNSIQSEHKLFNLQLSRSQALWERANTLEKKDAVRHESKANKKQIKRPEDTTTAHHDI